MVIIQVVQIVKTFSPYSIKKLFKFFLNKLVIIFSFFLYSCSNYLIQATDIKPDALYCGNTIGQFLKNDKNYLTTNDKNFREKLAKINSNFINKGYNLIVLSGSAINKKELSVDYLGNLNKETEKELSNKNISDGNRYILNRKLDVIKEIKI